MGGPAYTPEEVAKLLRVSRSTIYRLIADGKLPSFKVRGRRRIITNADLANYIGPERAKAMLEGLAEGEGWGQRSPTNEIDPETQAWLNAGLEEATQGICEAEKGIRQEEREAWLQAIAHTVNPLEAEHG